MSNYKCLFFDTRGCPTRKQMDISDEDLKKETIVTRHEQGILIRPTIETEPTPEYTKYKNTQNTADWLVNGFCRICPHREA